MENASGGFMSDLTFRGGRYGAWVGNQQFTVRHVTFEQCRTAICQHWNWAWTWMDVCVRDCGVALEVQGMHDDRQGVGALLLSDWDVERVPIVVELERASSGRLILERVRAREADAVVSCRAHGTLLAPRSSNDMVTFWAKVPSSQQSVVHGMRSTGHGDDVGELAPPCRPACLVDDRGRWFGQEKPSCTWFFY